MCQISILKKMLKNIKTKSMLTVPPTIQPKQLRRFPKPEREKAYRQNRVLLIFTIILGFLSLFVDIFSNLDRIISNIALLFCK